MDKIIEIERITKWFANKLVLDELSLDVREGETLVVIGPSGCGKSVLLKHIIGLLKPESGAIRYRGRDIAKMTEAELNEIRKEFGMLFQGAALFDSLSVGENIAFGINEHLHLPKDEVDKIVEEKLELVGMPGIAKLKPSELSGGMKKRVGLARAIAMNPKVILYDEPTTGLDPVMVSIIDHLVTEMKRKLGVTTVVVTHDMKSAYRTADRIAMHYGGKIVEVGTVEEIKNTKNEVVRQFIEGLMEGPITEQVHKLSV
jgi:phospholipid/cholesterol/gamma-HCH transport system ATP-binding protein